MWIYWLIICVVVIYYPMNELYISKKKSNMHKIDIDNRNRMSYFVIMSLLMILIIGLREKHIGNDTITYYNSYKRFAAYGFDYLVDSVLDEIGREKGYVFIQILFNKLHIPFEIFNIIYAAFNVVVISLFIYKKSKIVWLSYFLYIAYEFFVLDLTMMRQTTAMSIVVLAIMYDKNKTVIDFIKFAIIVCAASLIHSSAIICIPVWFMFKIPYSKKVLFVLFGIIAISYISKSFMVQLVFQLAANVSNKYEIAYVMQEGTAGIKLYFMIIATVLLGSYKSEFLQDKFNLKMHYLLILMLIIFPAVQGGGAIMRVYYYFYIFMIVYIPNMLYSIKNEKILYLIVILSYIAVGLSMYISSITGNSYNMVPYKFFWQ